MPIASSPRVHYHRPVDDFSISFRAQGKQSEIQFIIEKKEEMKKNLKGKRI